MTDDSALEAAALPLADYRSLAAAFPNRAVSLPGKRLGEIIARLDAAESRLAALPAPPGDTPAVNVLLGITKPGCGVDGDGTPFTCVGCPFAGPSVEPHAEIWNDEEEAHYPCSLLGKTVWGESPPCTREDWQARAKVELNAAAPPGDTPEIEQLRAEIARMKATCHHSSQEQIGDGQLRCDLCGAIEQDPFWRNPA